MNNQKQKIIETYKKKETTETFDSERSRYPFQKYKHEVEADFLKKAIDSLRKNKIKVLDVACGTGRMLPEIFSIRKEIEYHGLDTSKEMANTLKEKAKILGIEKQVKVKISDASKLPFKDNEFDVVFSYHLLWHLPKESQELIIKEMLRVTKKGGIIIFDFLNKNFIWEKMKGFLGKKTSEEIYKLKIFEARKLISGINKVEFRKLSDAPIKNDFLYKIFNLINKFEKILPGWFYHMIFLKGRK